MGNGNGKGGEREWEMGMGKGVNGSREDGLVSEGRAGRVVRGRGEATRVKTRKEHDGRRGRGSGGFSEAGGCHASKKVAICRDVSALVAGEIVIPRKICTEETNIFCTDDSDDVATQKASQPANQVADPQANAPARLPNQPISQPHSTHGPRDELQRGLKREELATSSA
eukprot:353315-Chlamydomonas_euryale.AAC.2